MELRIIAEDVISVVSVMVLVSDDSVVICVIIDEVNTGEIEEKGEKEGEVKVRMPVQHAIIRTRDDVGLGKPVK